MSTHDCAKLYQYKSDSSSNIYPNQKPSIIYPIKTKVQYKVN